MCCPARCLEAFDFGVREPLEEPEIEEGDAPVAHEERVARVWVTVEEPVTEGSVEVEACEDLADAIALGLWLALDLGKALAIDELGDDDALPAEVGDCIRHGDERVPAVRARHRSLIRGLQLV